VEAREVAVVARLVTEHRHQVATPGVDIAFPRAAAALVPFLSNVLKAGVLLFLARVATLATLDYSTF
jgi:hypothetical protein